MFYNFGQRYAKIVNLLLKCQKSEKISVLPILIASAKKTVKISVAYEKKFLHLGVQNGIKFERHQLL